MKTMKKSGSKFNTYSNIWTLSILTILFASLPEALVQFAYMQYINPSFIYDQIQTMTNMLTELNMMQNNEYIEKFIALYEDATIPASVQVVMQDIINNVFYLGLISIPVCRYETKKIKLINQKA